MEENETSNALLKSKYNLHKAPEVEVAAKRHTKLTGEKVPQDPLSRIQNYLNRFREITDRKDPSEREQGTDGIKRLLYRKNVIKPDEVPESYFENQRRIAREQGHGDVEITPQMREQLTEVMIADQRSSLNKWVDYLASPDAPYSDGLKYYTLRSVLSMNQGAKDENGKVVFTKREHAKRDDGGKLLNKPTTGPFPDLNREALAYVLDAIDKKYTGQQIDLAKLEEVEREQFEKLLASENFPKLYAWAIEKVTPDSQDLLKNTQGEWVRYEKGSDHLSLVQSLQGHGTGWCTAAESTAKRQLEGGDFYVYYSHDRNRRPTIPRVAIRMQKGNIAEVRGVASEQNIDSFIAPVVEEKIKEFPDGSSYQKKVEDMRRLTVLEHKTNEGQSLDSGDLFFLYEIDSPIEGFGYNKDPRIEEIRSQRNPEDDMSIVFGCKTSEIARDEEQIRPETKVYVGQLKAGIFDKLQHVEHLYTSFPERRVHRQTIEIGRKTAAQVLNDLKQAEIYVSPTVEQMLESSTFNILPGPQEISLVHLTVLDLNLTGKISIKQVLRRAEEFGLQLCPSEVGPVYRLKYTNQPFNEHLNIGVPEASTDDYAFFFTLNHDQSGTWVGGNNLNTRTIMTRGSALNRKFVFSIPKS